MMLFKHTRKHELRVLILGVESKLSSSFLPVLFKLVNIIQYQCQENNSYFIKISHSYFRYSIMKECWEEEPSKRPTFQWLCSAMKRLLDDHKVCLQLFPPRLYFWSVILHQNPWLYHSLTSPSPSLTDFIPPSFRYCVLLCLKGEGKGTIQKSRNDSQLRRIHSLNYPSI